MEQAGEQLDPVRRQDQQENSHGDGDDVAVARPQSPENLLGDPPDDNFP